MRDHIRDILTICHDTFPDLIFPDLIYNNGDHHALHYVTHVDANWAVQGRTVYGMLLKFGERNG
jgi:hypothetical protein